MRLSGVGHNGDINGQTIEKMIGETDAIDGNDGMVGASAPDFVKLFIEVRSGLRVDNETSFIVAREENILEVMRSDITTTIARDGDDADIFGGVTVISCKKSCFGFLEFWFDSGCLLLVCHDENSIPYLDKL